MTAAELLATLRRLKVRVRVENGQLRCSGPQGAITKDLRAALSAQKASIMAELEKLNAPLNQREPAIHRVPRDRSLPLSFAQQRLWFLDQLEPGSSVYNVPKAFRVRGPLSIARIEKGLNHVVARHEVLRTTIKVVDGRPVQKIAPGTSITCRLIDLSDRAEGRKDEARRLLDEEAHRPFDLSHGPLVRALVVRLAAEDHYLLITLHHIASDGWSMAILYREIAAAYDTDGDLRSTSLPELAVQYVDFAQWQRQWLDGELLQSHLRYWKGKLANIQPLNLPSNWGCDSEHPCRSAREKIVLPEALCQSLDKLSQDQRASLFMTFVAAFNVLLGRYSGQSDVVIGTPIAGRNRAEVENLIGFFVNTLVLRTNLAGDPTFIELLARVRETALDAYAHQDLPFEKLVEELAPERHVDAAPLIQVMFAYQNFPAAPLQLSGCSTELVELESGPAKFALTLQVSNHAEGTRCGLSYDTKLFARETAARMLTHFRKLLQEIVADPNRRISQLQILGEAERQQLLVSWNDNGRSYPRNRCIQELFEAQAKATPDQCAITFAGRRMSYRELNERANRLARRLRRSGIATEELVGVCVGRSLEMIVGLLGVLKAGGAYLPLDPANPRERLSFIVSDARCRVVLTERRFAQARHGGFSTAVKLICLDDECEADDQESVENLSDRVCPENLAYVMYTSGSTGSPKGVGVTHRNVIRLVKSQDYAELNTGEVLLQYAPLSFDASTFEIWGALLNGAKLVIAPPEALSPEQLGTVIEGCEVSTLWLTAALFHLMVDQALDSLQGVRQLLAGGDVLSTRHVTRALTGLPKCRLINGYGPTENTTFSCCFLAKPTEHAERSVPIGRPINQTQAYVLDESLSLVPQGMAGELYVSGDGLARGYFNNPELTAARFIPNPFTDQAGSRLYRTGDRVRYLADGNIEFLGRLDHQVKIRGFRIEPGEIESVLQKHPGVREAVVVAREDQRGEKVLVAYVVTSTEVESGTLRNFLKRQLPDYMLPSAIVHLDSLPLTSSGKLDRKALPAPDPARAESSAMFVAPATATEEALVAIWSELLQIEKIGIRDNFFNLGGHSLLATQVVSRVRLEFGVQFPLRSFFENPTIATFAERLELLIWASKNRTSNAADKNSEEVSL